MEPNNSKFSFLPWLRQGIASRINSDESFGELDGDLQTRATVDFRLSIDAVPVGGNAYESTGEENDIVQRIQIFGPGEVIGIERSAIVKTEPDPGITDFEPNYMPYIEFYEEDFNWRYTPARAKDGKLRPWLTLLVLEEEEYERKSIPGALLPTITHGSRDIPFPDAAQTWAYAHVHINQTLAQSGSDSNAEQLYDIVHNEDPNLASCRLLCQRRLKENTRYQAFLIPAFEQGRLAGLGAPNERILEEDVRKSSWAEHKADEYANVWPYYFEWQFSTGDQLDFEFLVRLIEPRVLDDNMGRRPMDCLDAGYEIKYEAGEGDKKGILDLEGALQSPVADNGYVKVVGETDEKKKEFLEKIKTFLNLNYDLKEPSTPDNHYSDELNSIFEGDEAGPDDPIVLPPMYGQWHAGEERINYDEQSPSAAESTYWFNQANLDPRNRAGAGLGTRVIQKDQEKYMDEAWGQVGEVLKAIRKLRLAELSVEASAKLFDKFFTKLDPAALVNLTALIHSKLPFSFGQTILSATTSTNVSQVFFNRGFSRLTRPNGPVFKRSSSSFDVNTINSSMHNNFGEIVSIPDAGQFAGNLFNFNNFQANVNVFNTGGGIIEGGIIEGAPWQGLDLDQIGNILNQGGFGGFGVRNLQGEEEDPTEFINLLGDYLKEENWNPNFGIQVQAPPASLEELQTSALEQMEPSKVITTKVWRGIRLFRDAEQVPQTEPIVRAIPEPIVQAPEEIVEVLAYPEFKDPMYIALKKYGEDYFLPGIDRIPENTFSILETNQRFIEAYMLGLNHEMARELLWREYPTDQKGSYFRKFWENIDGLPNANPYDINEITDWAGTGPLGHNHPDGADAANRLVFVIRGELLKRFPNTVIYLHKAEFIEGDPAKGRTLLEGPDPEKFYFPIFQGKADPDITFLGFDISPEDANGDKTTDPGYFVVVKERPGEPRFGLDLPPSDPDDLPDPNGNEFTWNDGNWTHITLDEHGFFKINEGTYKDLEAPLTEDEDDELKWGKNAAHMAGILYQLPFMVAIHADAMISDDILS